MVLDAATRNSAHYLDTQLESILAQLHTLICQPVDYSNKHAIKNQNEVLRCFTMLSMFSPINNVRISNWLVYHCTDKWISNLPVVTRRALAMVTLSYFIIEQNTCIEFVCLL